MTAYLNGVSGGGASTPNQAAFDTLNQSVDIRFKGALLHWTGDGSNYQALWSQGFGATGRWLLYIQPDGFMRFTIFGPASLNTPVGSTVALTIPDNRTYWVRGLLTPFGGNNATVDFYTSPDGITWTSLGTQVTSGAGTMPIQTPASPPIVRVGNEDFGSAVIGKMYRSQFLVNGVLKVDMNWEWALPGAGPWVADTGETWTALGTSTVIAEVDTRPVAGWSTRSGGL